MPRGRIVWGRQLAGDAVRLDHERHLPQRVLPRRASPHLQHRRDMVVRHRQSVPTYVRLAHTSACFFFCRVSPKQLEGLTGARCLRPVPAPSGPFRPLPEITCPALTNANGTAFPETVAGTTASGTCVAGYQGAVAGGAQLACGLDGTWASAVVNPCTRTWHA